MMKSNNVKPMRKILNPRGRDFHFGTKEENMLHIPKLGNSFLLYSLIFNTILIFFFLSLSLSLLDTSYSLIQKF